MKYIEGEWAVCTNPIVWGEVVFRHRAKVGIFVGDRTKTCSVDDVQIFAGEGAKGRAEGAYSEALTEATKVAERVKSGL